MQNLRDQYLASPTPTPGTAEAGDWGTIFVRSLTLAEMDRLEKAIAKDPAEALAVAVLLGVGTEDGKRVFADNDLAAVKSTSFATVKAAAEAVVKHNALNAEVVSNAKND